MSSIASSASPPASTKHHTTAAPVTEHDTTAPGTGTKMKTSTDTGMTPMTQATPLSPADENQYMPPEAAPVPPNEGKHARVLAAEPSSSPVPTQEDLAALSQPPSSLKASGGVGTVPISLKGGSGGVREPPAARKVEFDTDLFHPMMSLASMVGNEPGQVSSTCMCMC